MSECRHGESLYGRCVKCGMTWEEQAKVAEAREFRFEVGQRVRERFGFKRSGTIAYRYRTPLPSRFYIVRLDKGVVDGEVCHVEHELSPAPLRRGDTVERDQAGTIPAGTVVRSGVGVIYRRSGSGKIYPWFTFGCDDGLHDGALRWPVTVEIPAGDDE